MTQSFWASHWRCKIQILINLKYKFYIKLLSREWLYCDKKCSIKRRSAHEYFLPFIQSYIALGLLIMESCLWYLILSKYSFPHNTFLGPFAIKWRHCFFSSLKTLFLSQSEVYRLKCPSDHSMSIYKRRLSKALVFLRPSIIYT